MVPSFVVQCTNHLATEHVEHSMGGSDIILLHIQTYPNIKNSGYFYGTAGILESKKPQHISMPILVLFQEYPDRFAPKPFSLLVVSVSVTPMTFLSGRFPPNYFTLEFLTFEARQNQ